jgi:hypothetical protein
MFVRCTCLFFLADQHIYATSWTKCLQHTFPFLASWGRCRFHSKERFLTFKFIVSFDFFEIAAFDSTYLSTLTLSFCVATLDFQTLFRIIGFNVPAGIFAIAWAMVANAIPDFHRLVFRRPCITVHGWTETGSFDMHSTS